MNELKIKNSSSENLYLNINDYLNQNAENEIPKGWLKNSVLDLARNYFDKVDYELFNLNFSQPTCLEDKKNGSDNEDSRFFINSQHLLQNKEVTQRKLNYEVLGFSKKDLNVRNIQKNY